MKKKILVIDDEENILNTVKLLLREHDYDLKLSSSAHEGLNQLRQIKGPMIIFLDIMMPEMDGWEVLKNVKKEGLNSNKIFVMLTAKKIPDKIGDKYPELVVDYITKPFTKELLISKLDTLFDILEDKFDS